MADEPQLVEAEVVEGLPKPGKSFFHPASGVVILGLDWLAFGSDFVSGFLAVAVTSVLVFAATFGSIYWIQTRRHGDTPGRARLKAFLGALAAGVPFPIGGTLLGAAILLHSGLRQR